MAWFHHLMLGDRFREPFSNRTLKMSVTGTGKYIRETLEGPLHGHVILEASPHKEGGELEICSRITSEAIPDQFIPQIHQAIRSVIESELIEHRVNLHLTIAIVGGSYNKFSIPGQAFLMATMFAMREILDKGEWIEIE